MTAPSPADWRSVLKAIGWSIAFTLTGLACTLILLGISAALLAGGDFERGVRGFLTPGGREAVAAGVSQLAGFGIATWLIGIRALRLDRAALRWKPPGPGIRGMLAGLGIGAGAAALALLLAVALGSAHWSPDEGGPAVYALQVARTTAALAPAALSEELMFRGVPLVVFAAVLGRGSALLLVSGVVFGLLHARNPAATPLALGNIALAGLFLGAAFYARGGLWTAFGAHLGWNAALAALDAPVSGLPFDVPLLDYHAGEPVWLSGGPFGPEGGLAATAALAAAFVLTLRWARKETR
ncbi:MAG TPA: CPBP family intramembrane glutamic endopeptidase [Gemmatimonadales bacterium]|nr:CPBP family intramembrane glutamic endopeptidase [Gemmatimonadales bacterium]